MRCAVVGEIFVRFVVEMVEAAFGAEGVDGTQGGGRVDGARGIVRGNCDDRAGAWRDGGAHRVDVELVGRVCRDQYGNAVGHGDRHLVIEIIRRRQNEFVAGISEREHGVYKGIIAAGGDHHAVAVVRPGEDAVFGGEFLRESGEELGNAGDGLVFVIGGFGEETGDLFGGGGWRSVADDALSEGDCARMTTDEIRDHRDDRRLDGVEAAGFRPVCHGERGEAARGNAASISDGSPPHRAPRDDEEGAAHSAASSDEGAELFAERAGP